MEKKSAVFCCGFIQRDKMFSGVAPCDLNKKKKKKEKEKNKQSIETFVALTRAQEVCL